VRTAYALLQSRNTAPWGSALTRLCALQRGAVRLLHALAQMRWTARLRHLYMGAPDQTPGRWAPIVAAQLGPLAAWTQLRSLTISKLDSFHPGLLSALRQLTALSDLALKAQRRNHGGDLLDCGVFQVAGSALTRLESLSIDGGQRTSIQRLQDAMSRLTVLQNLEVHNVQIKRTCVVLRALTALTRLDIRWMAELPEDYFLLANPLPAGMGALRSLVELRMTCYHNPVPPLALPSLTTLQLNAPSFSGKVRLARANSCCVASRWYVQAVNTTQR